MKTEPHDFVEGLCNVKVCQVCDELRGSTAHPELQAIQRTGVFATEDEATECIRLFKIAQETPVMALSSEHALKQGGFSGQAWDRLNKTVHGYALAHDLPEWSGYYGIDIENREFIRLITEPAQANT